MTKRSERLNQFKNARMGGGANLSPALLHSAGSMLRLSLQERHRPSIKTHDNHPSDYAIGTIVLLVDGLEAWLNEVVWYFWRGDAENLKIADYPIDKKYYALPRRKAQKEIRRQPNLEMVLDVRNEIAHFLPRIITEERIPTRHVPPSLKPLFDHRLLFLPEEWLNSDEFLELPLPYLLSSYKLAYWSWRSVEVAVETFIHELRGEPFMDMRVASNFKQHHAVHPPDELSTYDAAHNLQSL